MESFKAIAFIFFKKVVILIPNLCKLQASPGRI